MRPTRPTLPALGLFILIVLTAPGCGRAGADRVAVHSVQGAITFKGRAIPGAFVTFHPKTPRDFVPTPRASVDASGTFVVSTFDGGDGAPEGEYVVTVQWYKPIRQGNDVVAGPNVIPRKYASAGTSDLTVRVAVGDNRLPPIRL